LRAGRGEDIVPKAVANDVELEQMVVLAEDARAQAAALATELAQARAGSVQARPVLRGASTDWGREPDEHRRVAQEASALSVHRPARPGRAGRPAAQFHARAGSKHVTNDPTAVRHPPAEILDGLHAMRLLPAGAVPDGEPLAGGVSSDIWRITLPGGEAICVKRALPKLKVVADWRAPVARNLYEARWMRHAGAAAPGSVPALLGQDEATGTLAMQWLPPADHAPWKQRLRDGQVEPAFAAEVARRLARVHAATAADPAVAQEFPTDAIFYAIRLEPYLLATARAHPDLAAELERLVAVTAGTKRALVHGDVSPKNILVGPGGPVFLDAECAWWGDPAFDLALTTCC
jgi:tRNA A-37 threonylcarbamoyl transferase component Bud32